MDEAQRAAYIQSQTACAMIEAMGMQSENKQREALGHSMAYGEEAFTALISRYGIDHNTVVMFLRD